MPSPLFLPALDPHAPVEVLYADAALLVAVKPAGLLSVPGRGDAKQDCLIARLQRDYPDVRIVHRLDQDTSGLLVVARAAGVHRELSRQFHDREVEKPMRRWCWAVRSATPAASTCPCATIRRRGRAMSSTPSRGNPP